MSSRTDDSVSEIGIAKCEEGKLLFIRNLGGMVREALRLH
jgi:hypothetical protein